MNTEIYLDIAKETTPIVVYAKQYDSDRSLIVHPLCNGQEYAPVNGTAVLNITRPDGTKLTLPATLNVARPVTVNADISADALYYAGIATAEIKITTSDKTVTSQPFFINIRESAGPAPTVSPGGLT